MLFSTDSAEDHDIGKTEGENLMDSTPESIMGKLQLQIGFKLGFDFLDYGFTKMLMLKVLYCSLGRK